MNISTVFPVILKFISSKESWESLCWLNLSWLHRNQQSSDNFFFPSQVLQPLGKETHRVTWEENSDICPCPWTCLTERELEPMGRSYRSECHHNATIICPCNGSVTMARSLQSGLHWLCLASQSLIYFLLILSKNSEEVDRLLLSFIGCFGKCDWWAGWMVLELVLSQ